MLNESPVATVDVNAALFCDFSDKVFLAAALQPFVRGSGPCLITDDATLLTTINPDRRIGLGAFRLDLVPIDGDKVLSQLRLHLAKIEGISCVVVDMSWGLATVHGASSYEAWGGIAENLAAEIGVPILSFYNKEHMIENQVQAAFRAHRHFIAPSGLYENPFWVPSAMIRDATLDEQLAFLLGRVVPDYAGGKFFKDVERQAARGATPDWLSPPQNSVAPTQRAARWHIHCLGRLTVYVGGKKPVDWRVPGGATNKTRALFAYLLHNGEKGAHTERVSELLWPVGGSESTKRARLHHTVAMLRKVLGGQETVLRSGDFYQLNVPIGSWLDITSFEQLCRRAISLARHGEASAALPVYFAADRLYGGDLFEDLPLDYVQPEHEDWCMPRRIWLREMALRVQYDMSKLLRKEGRTNQALEHVQRALALDPTNESANIEALRVFCAQGRIDAMHRHYKQYCAAVIAMGETPGMAEIDDVYQELCQFLDGLSADQRKTKVILLR